MYYFHLIIIFLFLKKRIDFYCIYLFYPIYLIFFCLEYVYGKRVILFGYISIYINNYKRSNKFIFAIVFSLFVFIFDKEILLNFFLYFKDIKRILLTIAKIITNFFTELSMWIIIYRR